MMRQKSDQTSSTLVLDAPEVCIRRGEAGASAGEDREEKKWGEQEEEKCGPLSAQMLEPWSPKLPEHQSPGEKQ